MDHDFWHERWQTGQIGFHEGRPNTLLTRHAHVLGAPGRVLVPLAGKSHDMLFLAAAGHMVVGVELSQKAVLDFFAENQLEASRRTSGPFEVYSAGAISLFVGDFFAFDATRLEGPFTALYDRASIVALPEAMRVRYAAHLRTLMPRGAAGLIVTFDYPQERMSGPPFSVTPAELERLYQGLALVEIEHVVTDGGPRFRDAGIQAIERVFSLTF